MRCSQFYYIRKINYILDFIIFKIIPMIVVLSLNLRLYFRVKSHFKNIDVKFSVSANKQELIQNFKKNMRADTKILFMGITITSIYGLMMLPLFLINSMRLLITPPYYVPPIVIEISVLLRLLYPFAASIIFIYLNKPIWAQFQIYFYPKIVLLKTAVTKITRDSFN
ncbi:hypothetical protein MXB_720 [Myxobolus squamalis]|nr:hypothetical protein MXB_720 [Myxobolus squamalis]